MDVSHLLRIVSEPYSTPEGLDDITQGNVVKICVLDADGNGEHFWCIVNHVVGDHVWAKVNNNVITVDWEVGKLISFKKHHIYMIEWDGA